VKKRTLKAVAVGFVLSLPAVPVRSVSLALEAGSQLPFEQVARDLASPDIATRLKAVRLLKEAAYPEAAAPLSALVTDPDDAVQAEAIAAELNMFLAEKVVPHKRIGYVIEVRNEIAAEAVFFAGPLALGSQPVPMRVLTALRAATRDDNATIGLDALYAFGVLGVVAGGAERIELLRMTSPELAAMLGSPSAAFRLATLRVAGRLFEKRLGDEPIDQALGDAVIMVLNDPDKNVRIAAMDALGAMRYDRAVQALTDLFRYYVRGVPAEAALAAVARIAHPTCVPLLTSQLSGRNGVMKGIAVEGLARAGDRATLTDIQAALSGERSGGILLAGQFAAAMRGGAPIDPIVEALGRERLRDQARQYLVELAPGRTEAFSRQAQDPDARRRSDTADVLGLAGDPAALSIVEPLLKDRDPQVVLAAERAAQRLRSARHAG
jgi:HEAT repeat protein